MIGFSLFCDEQAINAVRAAAALKDGGAQRHATLLARTESQKAFIASVENGIKIADEESVSLFFSLWVGIVSLI